MTWNTLELMFNRAFRFAFSRKKLLFFAPILVVCAFLCVLCRSLAMHASDWVTMSLAFLPIFGCSAVLLASGVVLTRIYHDELKGQKVRYRETLQGSWNVMVGIAYLSLPLSLTYLLLWTVQGFFYLLRDIPFIGSTLALFFSFVPFLLVLGSITLVFLSLLLLFFAPPLVALQPEFKLDEARQVLTRIKQNPFSHLALFFLGILPFFVVGGVLLMASIVTGATYIEATHSWGLLLQASLMMLPFCLLLAPFIIFFFNFAAESFVYMKKGEEA